MGMCNHLRCDDGAPEPRAVSISDSAGKVESEAKFAVSRTTSLLAMGEKRGIDLSIDPGRKDNE